jgi:hypothetical protein
MGKHKKHFRKDFMDYVYKPSSCWIWGGSKNTSNYGVFQYEVGGKFLTRLASRIMWEKVNGPIPEGKFVCHKCDNSICVNPDHLFLGTHQDNMLDMHIKGLRGRPPILSIKSVKEIKKIWDEKGNKERLTPPRSKEFVTMAELAVRYGVSHVTISHIINNVSWEWLDNASIYAKSTGD